MKERSHQVIENTQGASEDSGGKWPSAGPETVSLKPGTKGGGALLPILLLVFGALAMFWRPLFTSEMLFYRDVSKYTYPVATFIHDSVRRGWLPYWNPYLSFGEPLLSNPNFLFFYPYTLFIILLPVKFAYTLHYPLHFAVAGAGTYLLARRWRQSRTAAFLAAAFFMLSGPILSLGNFYNQAACTAWLPWALLATDHAIRSCSWRPWILLSVVLGLQLLAGEPFTLLASYGLCLGYAFFERGSRQQVWCAANRRVAARFIMAGVAMVALCAIQFFPSLALLHNARRGTAGLSFQQTSYWSLNPLALLDVVIPGFFGDPLGGATPWTEVLGGANQAYFVSVSVGFIPLFFALAGWIMGEDRRRHFAAIAALLLLFVAFGRFTPVFAETYLLVPLLQLVRFPVKMFAPALLPVCLLSGFGIDALGRACWREESSRTLRSLLSGTLGAVLLAWLAALIAPEPLTRLGSWLMHWSDAIASQSAAEWLPAEDLRAGGKYWVTMLRLLLPGLAGFLLGSLLWLVTLARGKDQARRLVVPVALLGVAQLAWQNYAANPVVPPGFYSYRPPALDQPRDPRQPYRFAFLYEHEPRKGQDDPQRFINFDSIPEAAHLSPAAQAAFLGHLELERGTMLSGVEVAQNADLEGSLPSILYDFWIFARAIKDQPGRFDCLLGRANVKYIARKHAFPSPATRLAARIFNGSPRPGYLYEDLCFTPRAFAAGEAVYAPGADDTLALLSSPDFNPLRQVILESPPPLSRAEVAAPMSPGPSPAVSKASTVSARPEPNEGTPGLESSAATGAAGSVEIVERNPAEVVLNASLARPGYVVLLDQFDPNWHATVDGRETPVLRANHLFRAVCVEAGRHVVRFYYRQKGLASGIIVSLVALGVFGSIYNLDPRCSAI